MKNKLTPKREAFSLKYVECSNASEAYRHAFDVSEDAKPEGIWVNACKILADAKVALRVFELQEALAKRTMVTVESLSIELDENRALAEKTSQPAAMNGATMGKAKLHGLDVHKVEADIKVTGSMEVNPSDKLADFLNTMAERKE